MIKISHEVPISLLPVSFTFNDYDYSLVHMLDESEEYYNFYKRYARSREQILDNSAYELGDSFDVNKFACYVEDIQPSHYIIPDKIADYEATVNYFEWFTNEYKDLPGKKIGVVQGTTPKEFMECFKFMYNKCDKLAIPFHSLSYLDSSSSDIDEVRCNGRVKYINKLVDMGFTNKPIHLLGCSLPQEFTYYKNISIIESIDTSNPVILGIQLEEYNINDNGFVELDYKPKGMVDYNQKLNHSQLQMVLENIKNFRKNIYK